MLQESLIYCSCYKHQPKMISVAVSETGESACDGDIDSTTRSHVTNDVDSQQTSFAQTSNTSMSKNQLKKEAKRQRMLLRRPELRRLEKEKKKRKRLELAAKKPQSDCQEVVSVQRPFRTLMSESSNRFRVVIDLDFEDFMTDDEIGKAVKQCKNSYATNRKSPNPCQLYISSIKPGKIRDRFATTCSGYENWDVHLSELDYVDMFLSSDQTTTNEPARQMARDEIKRNIVYLTADSEELLPDADEIIRNESKIFVIGGLVDHNRHKNLCYTRAQERQVRTAKLPISENLKLCQRHILSTVTVFDILLNVLGEHKSWRDALKSAIPRRKIDPSEF